MRLRAHIPRQLIALLLVVLSMVQPVLGIAHAQAHAHRYCVAHRTFEEASASAGSTRSTLEQPGWAFATRTSSAADAASHEECTFTSTHRREQRPAPEVQTPPQRCLGVSAPATAPPRPVSSLSVLATAPKASPPARA